MIAQSSTHISNLITEADNARRDFRDGRICRADYDYAVIRADVAVSNYKESREIEDVILEKAGDMTFRDELLLRISQAVETIAAPERYETSGLIAEMATAAYRVFGDMSLADLRKDEQ